MEAKRKKVLAALAACASVTTGVVVAQSAIAAPPAPAQAGQQQATRIIVGYKAGAAEATSFSAAAADADAKTDGRLVRRLGTGASLVDLGAGADLDAALAAFRADPSVAYAEPDLMVQRQAEPNDPEYAKQWDLFEAKAGMNVPGAWAQSTGAGVTVAVIDTGYVRHSDLAAQMVPGYDFISNTSVANDGDGRDSDPADPGDWLTRGECGTDNLGRPVPPADTNSSWHGTHVAGTIAAQTGNGKGVAGIAYDAKIQPIRVLGKCGGMTSDIADAITWASGGAVPGVPANQNPAKVLNLSLGGQSACLSTYQNAINGAVRRGSTVVIAAGNSNMDVSGFTPANCDNVVAVASSNRVGDRAFYSNYGAKIDVAAPGGEVRRASDPPGSITTPENGIWSTLNTGDRAPGSENYEPYMGTSMAAPHVAGVAALMVARNAELTPAQVETLLKENTRPLPGTCSGGCGTGLVDTVKTVAAVDGGEEPPAGEVEVVNPGNQSGKVGVAVSLQVKATASTPEATLSHAASGLPAGLSVNSASGLISGTPTAAGTSNVTVTVTDSAGKRGTAQFTWTVTAANGGGTVTVADPGYQLDFRGWFTALRIQASSSDGSALTYQAAGLPPGLSVNSSTGVISGVPSRSGVYSVTVTATNAGGASGKTTFTWYVF
ncbi:S8 family serine peptidase [Actinokineospora fastidiosa]|uniref:Serine protease n=1 Tax=Actinokineospora fastidiosa TaxID=1816 RepID=A0A918GL20_9PSEU|nr:S8 family serine peptidase [Actinokineospora fastidiosa]GGS43774.1 hypothetical protein GCM10010171_43670 [Actinokineospora fastidiosa]